MSPRSPTTLRGKPRLAIHSSLPLAHLPPCPHACLIDARLGRCFHPAAEAMLARGRIGSSQFTESSRVNYAQPSTRTPDAGGGVVYEGVLVGAQRMAPRRR